MGRPLKSQVLPQTQLVEQILKYLEHCQYVRNYTASTLCDKRRSLLHFARHTGAERLENVTTQMVQEWVLAQTKHGNKPRTVNDRLKHFKALANYYLDEEMKLPFLNLRKIHKQHEEPANKRAFSRETIREALKYADRETWVAIKLCFDCGLRMNELRHIKLSDIDEDVISISGKGRKHRFAIMCAETQENVVNLIIKNHLTKYLFESDRTPGMPKSAEHIRSKARAAFAAAGVENFCMHELRHSYATDLKRLGATNRQIQQGLGHSSEKITEIYLHDLDASSLKELYKLKYSVENPNLR